MMMQGFLICRILGGGVGSTEPALGSAVPAAMLPQPLSLPTPAPAASAVPRAGRRQKGATSDYDRRERRP